MRQRHPVMRGWAQSHPPGARQRTFAKGAPHLLTLWWGGRGAGILGNPGGGAKKTTVDLHTGTTGGALDRVEVRKATGKTDVCSVPCVCRFVGIASSQALPIRLLRKSNHQVQRGQHWRVLCRDDGIFCACGRHPRGAARSALNASRSCRVGRTSTAYGVRTGARTERSTACGSTPTATHQSRTTDSPW